MVEVSVLVKGRGKHTGRGECESDRWRGMNARVEGNEGVTGGRVREVSRCELRSLSFECPLRSPCPRVGCW